MESWTIDHRRCDPTLRVRDHATGIFPLETRAMRGFYPNVAFEGAVPLIDPCAAARVSA